MAIDKAPNIWTSGLIDKIAELVGKEFESIYADNYWKFYTGTSVSIPEEWLIETAISNVTGKIRLIMPDEVYSTIYDHPLLDRYLEELEEEVERERPSHPQFGFTYVSTDQQLREVGMSQRDFI